MLAFLKLQVCCIFNGHLLMQAYMFKYDSTHGTWKHGEVKTEGGKLVIGNMHIMVFQEYVTVTRALYPASLPQIE